MAALWFEIGIRLSDLVMDRCLSVVVLGDCEVIPNNKLPPSFSVENGLRFHLWFNGESHPGKISNCKKELLVGERGEVEIMFTALHSEKKDIVDGIEMKLVGGVDVHFANCKLMKVISISE